MTEADWLNGTDPQAMLDFLRDSGKLCERKARLFAVACCRRIWQLLSDERSRRAVETLEGFTEGRAGLEELAAAAQVAQEVAEDQESTDNPYAAAAAANAVHADFPPELRGPEEEEEVPSDSISNAKDTAFASAWATGHALHPEDSGDAWFATIKVEEGVQAHLLRDIVGNPFCPRPPLPPSVRTWNEGTVVRLAQVIYEERELPSGHLDRHRLAVFADALEEAGCSNPDILNHLRGPGPHVRGCHVVDLVRSVD